VPHQQNSLQQLLLQLPQLLQLLQPALQQQACVLQDHQQQLLL
jgi:hypothetical protein